MSLGVDLVLPKICSLDCRYCELGPTTNLTTKRDRYRDPKDVLDQVRARLAELSYDPDYITLAGSGEPTLHQDLGMVLKELKAMSPAKVAVLTNGTLTPDPQVRSELCQADVLVPSLDAVSDRAFRRLNRPAPGLNTGDIIEGLSALRREFEGEFLLEILLALDINDSDEEVALLVEAADRIAPDMVQLNTVVRPPSLAGTKPVPDERLAGIAKRFNVPCQVIAPPQGHAQGDHGSLGKQLVELTRRRPLTLGDVAAAFGLKPAQARELIDGLIDKGEMKAELFGEETFYRGV